MIAKSDQQLPPVADEGVSTDCVVVVVDVGVSPDRVDVVVVGVGVGVVEESLNDIAGTLVFGMLVAPSDLMARDLLHDKLHGIDARGSVLEGIMEMVTDVRLTDREVREAYLCRMAKITHNKDLWGERPDLAAKIRDFHPNLIT